MAVDCSSDQTHGNGGGPVRMPFGGASERTVGFGVAFAVCAPFVCLSHLHCGGGDTDDDKKYIDEIRN